MDNTSIIRMLSPVSENTSPSPTIEEFVEYRDAYSRIAIALVNAANSWRIRQYGVFTPDAIRGGFIAPDGRIAISGDARRNI